MFLRNYDLFKIENHYQEIADIPAILIQGTIPSETIDISITIPTFKRIKTLKATIESALAQGDYNYNIIVVDNNPERNDETEIFMKEYKDNDRILYYKNSENLGMSGNWSRCVELSTGKWLVLIHDDDLLAHDYIKLVMPCLAHDVDVIFQKPIIFNDNESLPTLQRNGSLQIERVDLKDCFLFQEFSPSGNMFKKEEMLRLGGFHREIFAPDSFFFVLCSYSRCYRLNQKCVFYRKGINESTKISAMDEMCLLNHNLRPQIWKRIGVPRVLIDSSLLYSDLIFERAFQKTWNKDFVSSIISSRSLIRIFWSKLCYNISTLSIRLIRKIQRETIMIEKNIYFNL